MKIYKLLISEDTPVVVDGMPYYNICIVALAADESQARSLMAERLMQNGLTSDFLPFATVTEIALDSEKVVSFFATSL